MAERPGLDADDVLVAVTTLSFDIAGLELYLPLIVGRAASCSRGADDRRIRARWRAARTEPAPPSCRRRRRPGGCCSIPAGRAARGLKALCGGEALPVALADGLLGLGVELWNMYGPTETTIWSTCKRVDYARASR